VILCLNIRGGFWKTENVWSSQVGGRGNTIDGSWWVEEMWSYACKMWGIFATHPKVKAGGASKGDASKWKCNNGINEGNTGRWRCCKDNDFGRGGSWFRSRGCLACKWHKDFPVDDLVFNLDAHPTHTEGSVKDFIKLYLDNHIIRYDSYYSFLTLCPLCHCWLLKLLEILT